MAGNIEFKGPERPRLLLLGNDAGLRRSLQLLLRAQGYEVRAFSAGAHLLAEPLDRAACCLIADCELDDPAGLDVLARLRARGWFAPAILISHLASKGLEERALAAGFDVVLEKPCREHVLVETIGQLVDAGRAGAGQKAASRHP